MVIYIRSQGQRDKALSCRPHCMWLPVCLHGDKALHSASTTHCCVLCHSHGMCGSTGLRRSAHFLHETCSSHVAYIRQYNMTFTVLLNINVAVHLFPRLLISQNINDSIFICEVISHLVIALYSLSGGEMVTAGVDSSKMSTYLSEFHEILIEITMLTPKEF